MQSIIRQSNKLLPVGSKKKYKRENWENRFFRRCKEIDKKKLTKIKISISLNSKFINSIILKNINSYQLTQTNQHKIANAV